MKPTRPTQISSILQTVSARDNATTSAELEAYIADLEAKQPDRPARITTLLQTVSERLPAELVNALEAYIADLEAKQQPLVPGNQKEMSYDPSNPPFWSHQRDMERAKRRHERALRKLNDYQ